MLRPTIELDYKVTGILNGCCRLEVWIKSYSDMTPDIFLYQRFPVMDGEVQPDNRFINVASVGDINEYPETDPSGDGPFYRLRTVDLTFRSIDLLNKTWDLIQEDTLDLVANLRGLAILGTDITVDFNMEHYNSSSSSQGESTSSASSLSSQLGSTSSTSQSSSSFNNSSSSSDS
jgi:hypothetical protein